MTGTVDSVLSAINVEALTPEQRAELLELLERRERLLDENRLARFKPYPKQQLFFEAGAFLGVRERLLIAGNQNGKSIAVGAEVAYHLTGLYPSWWRGWRWNRPTKGWAAGVTSLTTRDNPQRILLGDLGAWGTGWLPKQSIVPLETNLKRASHSVADAVDSVRVRHVSGGYSLLQFKAYEQGREKFQGPSLDFFWADEEPGEDVYAEMLARLTATRGIGMMTFTPLKGMSNVVRRFIQERVPGTFAVNMTIEDALHISPEDRAAIIAGYPLHEREARARGIPTLGSGRIYPIEEAAIAEGVLQPPHWWPRLAAIDFGFEHPTAIVWFAWDRDNDCIHVYDCWRQSQATPLVVAETLRARGRWIPVAWPHDGDNETHQAHGESLATQYRAYGVAMMPHRACFEDKTTSVEAGIQDLLTRMQTGRFKVARHLTAWWEEFRLYHRKDGKVVRLANDLMDATRYGAMMLRYAEIAPNPAAVPVVPVVRALDPLTGY